MNISFRSLTAADFPLLACWQAQPHVARWWPEPSDLASITAHYLPGIEGDVATEV